MSKKWVTDAYKFFDSAVSATTTTTAINTKRYDNVGVQVNYVSDASADFTVDVLASIDGENFTELSIDQPTIGSSETETILFNLNQLPFEHVKIRFNRIAGELTSCSAWVQMRDLN